MFKKYYKINLLLITYSIMNLLYNILYNEQLLNIKTYKKTFFLIYKTIFTILFILYFINSGSFKEDKCYTLYIGIIFTIIDTINSTLLIFFENL